jgi:sugar lactone lactonase YvrE
MKTFIFYILFFLEFNVAAQNITTFAGGGVATGDGVPATANLLNAPNGSWFDKYGNYFFALGFGRQIKKVNPSGIITTVAGTGTSGVTGDGGPATAACLTGPTDVVVDTFGNIYISDLANFRVRKVNGITGIISTIAGTGVGGYNGDNIPATAAQIQGNEQIWVDKQGNVFICDRANFRIRKINAAGIISTVAGGGFSSFGTGDGGPATSATFNEITGVAVDDQGNIFIADYNCGRVRRVNTLGIISTIAGNGSLVYAGDNVPATNVQMVPLRLTFDHTHNLVIADRINRRVLRIDGFGIIHCISGNGGSGFSGDGGPATAATLDFPAGIAFDACDNLYIAEAANNRVRKVTFNPPPCTYLNVNMQSNENQLSIHPNPTPDQLNINPKSPSTYRLINILGTTTQQGTLKAGDNTIFIKALPTGMYMLELTDEERNRTVTKIIKQ